MKEVVFFGSNSETEQRLERAFEAASDLCSNGWKLRYTESNGLDKAALEAYRASGSSSRNIEFYGNRLKEGYSGLCSRYVPVWDGLSTEIKSNFLVAISALYGTDNEKTATLVIYSSLDCSPVVKFLNKVEEDRGYVKRLDMSSPDFEKKFKELVLGDVSPESRIKNALEIAHTYSQIDGDHHKKWTIDTMVRALLGDPFPEEQKDTPEYKEFIKSYCDGEDGPETYSWDIGIAP